MCLLSEQACPPAYYVIADTHTYGALYLVLVNYRCTPLLSIVPLSYTLILYTYTYAYYLYTGVLLDLFSYLFTF